MNGFSKFTVVEKICFSLESDENELTVNACDLHTLLLGSYSKTAELAHLR
jgi:hypothetical protein